jgi:predicted Fe-Mo cluster-binding NifX family protein
MKLAITAERPELDSRVDPRFGRAAYFIVYDTDTDQWAAHDNAHNLNAPSGAGIQAARNVVDLGAAAVATGHVGPKAYSALQAGNVAVFLVGEETVAECVEKFKADRLTRAESADVAGHW